MHCCYCTERLDEGDHVVRVQRIGYRAVDDPEVGMVAIAIDDWGHIGCWRLALRQAEDDATRRREQKRARLAASAASED